ncbi:hypothetical protein [Serpentinicella alkaliphila]|nr:hypothetical protein [Serpentinicella alkaliphila]QUH26424.1 hypothetical protein HZR23_12275 [Serpentinicella alkaliphila]
MKLYFSKVCEEIEGSNNTLLKALDILEKGKLSGHVLVAFALQKIH